jgi:hypothetical protein
VLDSCQDALSKEGTLGCYAADILHGVAVARSLGLDVRLVDRLRGRREKHGVATGVSEAKIETYFALSKHAGTSVPGRQTPSRSVDPAEASLDVVKRQAPHLVKGASRNARREPRTWVGDLDRQ